MSTAKKKKNCDHPYLIGMGVLSALHSTKMGYIEDAPFWLNGNRKICEIYHENHLYPALHSTKIWHIEWGYYYNYVQLVKSENMPKKISSLDFNFFWCFII